MLVLIPSSAAPVKSRARARVSLRPGRRPSSKTRRRQAPKQAAAQAAPVLVRHVVEPCTASGSALGGWQGRRLRRPGSGAKRGNISAQLTSILPMDPSTMKQPSFAAPHLPAHHLPPHSKRSNLPSPIDLMIDTRTQQVTVHSQSKDGKDEVKTRHMHLPPDLADGLSRTSSRTFGRAPRKREFPCCSHTRSADRDARDCSPCRRSLLVGGFLSKGDALRDQDEIVESQALWRP